MKIKGIEVLIDEVDLALIRDYNWSWSRGYLQARVDGKVRYLHCMVAERTGLDVSNEIDHIDGNKTNNQRKNLRSATRSQNARNRKIQSNNTSGFKGVCWDKDRNKYRAYIRVDYKLIHLGYFDDPIEAARVYDKAAILYFGEFAKLNFLKE